MIHWPFWNCWQSRSFFCYFYTIQLSLETSYATFKSASLLVLFITSNKYMLHIHIWLSFGIFQYIKHFLDCCKRYVQSWKEKCMNDIFKMHWILEILLKFLTIWKKILHVMRWWNNVKVFGRAWICNKTSFTRETVNS